MGQWREAKSAGLRLNASKSESHLDTGRDSVSVPLEPWAAKLDRAGVSGSSPSVLPLVRRLLAGSGGLEGVGSRLPVVGRCQSRGGDLRSFVSDKS